MIECIFTIDYEIYGNGEGSLKELVYEPTERIRTIFEKWHSRFVVFVEAAELEIIESHDTDPYITSVRRQVKSLFDEGFEIGLHLHPQWYNAQFHNGRWILDYSEYNLCTLSKQRIAHIIQRSIDYLRDILDEPDFTPTSFRAGNWLFQPTGTLAAILAEKGVKIDSSVFKGGLQRNHGLDYRPALKNGNYWRFQSNVNTPDAQGALTELPTYTIMVPFWKMLGAKRISVHRKSLMTSRGSYHRLSRLPDYIRLMYPLKFDFCRLTLHELISMIRRVIKEDQESPTTYKPMVAIGHTKDLVDTESVQHFLSYLKQEGIAISTFEGIYDKCKC